MKLILALVNCSYAHKGEPWKEQVHLKAGQEYTVTRDSKVKNGVTPDIAQRAVDAGKAEEVEVKQVEAEVTSVPKEEFDPRAASHEEMKAFIKADADLDELIDLRLSEDDLREELISLLEDGAE